MQDDIINDIIVSLEMMGKEEKTNVAYEIITEGLCDTDQALNILGMSQTEAEMREKASDSVETNCWDMISDIPTEEVQDYVHKIMNELR